MNAHPRTRSQVDAVVSDPEPLLSLKARVLRTMDLVRVFHLSDTDVGRRVYGPLAARFVGSASRAEVAILLATDLGLAAPWTISSLYRRLRLPENLGSPTPTEDAHVHQLQRQNLVRLQSMAREAPDLAALIVEIQTSTVSAHDARAFLVLDAEVGRPGRGTDGWEWGDVHPRPVLTTVPSVSCMHRTSRGETP